MVSVVIAQDQLSHILSHIFCGWSLQLHKVHCPCTKHQIPHDWVQASSLFLKSFEQFIKNELLHKVQANLDALQFAYKPKRG